MIGAATPWWVGGGLGVVLLLFVLIAFPRRRSRAIAAATLLPLAALAGLVAWSGRAVRAEASDAQAAMTTFGDGAQTPGASHAAGSGVVGEGGAAAPSAPAAGLDLAAALAAATQRSGAALSQGPEGYTPSTLWNRIDGGAEHYTKRGMAKALFATLTKDGTDFEVQLFAMRSAPEAQGLWDATERDAAAPHPAGDRAVTWPGGGELLAGELYARVVASTGTPSAADAAVITQVIDGLAAAVPSAGAAQAAEAAPPGEAAAPARNPGAAPGGVPGADSAAAQRGDPAAAPGADSAADPGGDPSAAPGGAPGADRAAAPGAAPGGDPAAAPGADPGAEPGTDPAASPSASAEPAVSEAPRLPPELDALYGLGAAEPLPSGLVRRKTRGVLEAWALCQATRPDGAEPVGRFGWWYHGAGMVTQGAAVLSGVGEAAREALSAASTPALHPALGAFGEDEAVRVSLSGWAGRGALGLTLVAFRDDLQLFVSAPRDARKAWTALEASLHAPQTDDGRLSGDDAYAGRVVAVRAGKWVLGASGAAPIESLRAAVDLAAQRLAATSP